MSVRRRISLRNSRSVVWPWLERLESALPLLLIRGAGGGYRPVSTLELRLLAVTSQSLVLTHHGDTAGFYTA